MSEEETIITQGSYILEGIKELEVRRQIQLIRYLIEGLELESIFTIDKDISDTDDKNLYFN